MFGKGEGYKAKMWAVHFGSYIGSINAMETFKVRKVIWIRPWGALKSSFHWCFPRFYTSDKNYHFFMRYCNKQKLLTASGDGKKWGDYAPGPTRRPSGYRIATYLWSFQGTFMLGRRLDFIKAYFLPQISI